VDGMRSALLTALANWLDIWDRDGFAAVRSSWLARAHPPGTTLRVVVGDRTIEGRFADLAPDGALLLDTAEGRKRYVAGDVSLSAAVGEEACPPA
ncbi:MAG TPA: biotin--[acetyl-CoA-carboxylase] ligase, partial [Acetobacteraceae bacterium]|nr:biotin--[acetyl-CoA-carboxylase] ligase [Acetobacteraceae bacterium]